MKNQKSKPYSYEQRIKRREESKTYSLERLEEMILKRWDIVKRDYYYSKKMDDELEDLLYSRKWKMNYAFEWTPENVEKLLNLNQKLINCFEKIKAESEQSIKTLQKRIDEKDRFLHNFNIYAHIYPYIDMPDEDGELDEPWDGMERILMDSLERHVLDIGINIECLNDMIYLDKEQNWNFDLSSKGKFSEYFISQGIHELYSHTCWSFPDILRINRLNTELKIILDNDENV